VFTFLVEGFGRDVRAVLAPDGAVPLAFVSSGHENTPLRENELNLRMEDIARVHSALPPDKG